MGETEVKKPPDDKEMSVEERMDVLETLRGSKLS